MIALVLCGLAKLGTVQTVDLVEINHMHDEKGRHTFSQIIFWDVDPVTRKRHVREWYMADVIRDIEWLDIGPRVTLKPNSHEIIVQGRSYMETWTQIDPEREDLKVWPDRVGLARCKR
jgi:hypothetical protein